MNRKHNIRTEIFPSLIMGTFMMVTSVTLFYITIFFSEILKFSGSRIGFLFSLHALTGMFAALPAGISNDRITSRVLIMMSLIVQSVSFVLMSMVKSFWIFLPVFFLWSLSSWLFRWSMDTQMLKSQSSREIGSRIGFYQACRFVGLTIGTIFSGYSIAKLDFETTLMTVGGVCLLLVIPSAFLQSTRVAKISFAEYKADFSNRKVIFFALWLLLFASHWGAEQTSYGLFLKKQLHLNMIQMGWYTAAEFAAIILTVIIAGDMIGRNGNARKIAILGLFGSGIGHIGMIFPPISLSVAFRILHGFGDGCMTLVMFYGVTKLFAIEHIGGNGGMINFATMIGYIIGSMVYGHMGESLGYDYPLWISGTVVFLLMIPLLYYSDAAEDHAESKNLPDNGCSEKI